MPLLLDTLLGAGFVVGALIGLGRLLYAKTFPTSRASGGFVWPFMMACAGIGWLIGSLISYLLVR